MSEERYRPAKGDRVRVVLEGEVHHADHLGVTLNWDTGSSYASAKSTVSVEKLEPPVEVFGPGDTLRGKGLTDLVVTLGHDGYLNHGLGRYITDSPEYMRHTFTSRHYERVELPK